MKKLFLSSEQKESVIPIYVDDQGDKFILASTNETRSIMFRQIVLLEDKILVFHGSKYKEEDVEIIETS